MTDPTYSPKEYIPADSDLMNEELTGVDASVQSYITIAKIAKR